MLKDIIKVKYPKETAEPISLELEPKAQLAKYSRGRLCKYLLLIAITDIKVYLQFDNLYQKEINRLFKKGVFEIAILANIL